MAKKPGSNPKHRRIYVTMRIKQILEELKALKPKIGAKLSTGAKPDTGDAKAHREFVFSRLRFQELRKELGELRAENKTTQPKGAPAANA
jgi:hypothetical protein